MMTGIVIGAVGVIGLAIGCKTVGRLVGIVRDVVSAATSVATDF